MSLNTVELATSYLSIYLGEPSYGNWNDHVQALAGQLQKKYSNREAKVLVKKSIACALLLPIYDKTKVPDAPENLLFQCRVFRQFESRDWTTLIDEIVDRDDEIRGWRSQALSLGIVHPLEFVPSTRQAYNWLYNKAEESGALTPETKHAVSEKYKKLVYAYGGDVISKVFAKEEKNLYKKILNWKSNYFFERLIFEVFTPEQVMQIKRNELKKVNSKLVRSIRV